MFFNRHKKNNTNKKAAPKQGVGNLKSQKYFFKISLPTELTPEKNDDTDTIIKAISKGEALQENKLELTFPYASLKTTDELLLALKEQAMKTDQKNIYVTLELNTWDEKQKKVIDFVTFDQMEINYHFKTVLQNIFEEIVNNNTTGLDTDMMTDFLSELKDVFVKNSEKDPNSLPAIPSEQDMLSSDYYHAEVPTDPLAPAASETSQKSEPANEFNSIKDQDTVPEAAPDQESGQKPDPKPDDDQVEPATNTAAKSSVASDQIGSYINREHVSSRSTYSNIIEDLKAKALSEQSMIKTITTEAPEFSVNDVKAANPYDPQYVDYMLKLRREQYNSQLKRVTEQLNADAENKVLSLHQSAQKFFDEALTAAQKAFTTKPEEIKATVREKTLVQKKDEAKIEAQKIETQFANERNVIEQDYQAKLASVKNNQELALQRLDHDLATKYAAVEQEQINLALSQTEKDNQKKIVASLKPKAEQINSDLNIQYNELRKQINGTLQQAFDKLQDTLPDYERDLQEQYLNAVETHAIEQRAKDIGLQNEQVQDSNKRLLEQNEKLIEQKVALDKEIGALNSRFEEVQTKLDKLPEQAKEDNSALKAEMDKLKTAVMEKQQRQKKLNKEIIGAAAILALLGIGSGTTYAMTKQQEADHFRTENTRLKAASNTNHNQQKPDASATSKGSDTKASAKQPEKNRSTNQETNGQETQNKADETVINQPQQKNQPAIERSLPAEGESLINNGKYTQALKSYPEYANTIEQQAFANGDLAGVKAANETGTTKFGTIDEAILSQSPNLIVAAYENAGKPKLELSERANAVGRAYLKRNQFNAQANDYLNAVAVYQANQENATALLQDLRYFEIHHNFNN